MATDTEQQQSPTAPTEPPFKEWLGSLLAQTRRLRSWASQHRVKSGLIVASAMAAVALPLAGVWILAPSDDAESVAETLPEALAMLDAGNYVEARELARRLRDVDSLPLQQRGTPVLVLGAAMAYEAEATRDARERAKFYLLASRYLEEARDRGFPPERWAQGLLLLAKSLYYSDQFAQSLPVLHEALEANTHEQTQLHKLLSGAYFRDANPNWRHALHWSTKYLADRMLSPDDRHAGLLEQSQILFKLDQIDAARKVLTAIPSEAANRAGAIVMQGRLLMHQADRMSQDGEDEAEVTKKYAQAIQVLRQAQGRDTSISQVSGQSAYLIGVCYRKLKDDRAAVDQFNRTDKMHNNTPEALAAMLAEAEILRERQEDDEAVAAYRRAFHAAGAPSRYSNLWVSLDEFRARTMDAYHFYMIAGKPERAIELTRLFTPIFSKSRATELKAEGHVAWGENELRRAADLPESQARPLRRQARLQFRTSGQTYAKLAKLRVTTRDYPDAIWHSAESYLRGQAFDQAVSMLEQYLDNEARRRRPRALVASGEVYLALDEVDKALEALLECVEFYPNNPAVYEARLLASRAHLEKGQVDQAKELLTTNLHDEALTPKSVEWRDSLYALGKVLYAEGNQLETGGLLPHAEATRGGKVGAADALEQSFASYQESIRKLKEAVQRYPDVPQAIESRYLIAEAHRRSAKLPQRKIVDVTIETTRITLGRQLQQQLSEALAQYDELQRLLNQRRQQKTELSPLETAILRNCYFARGALLFDMERYEESIAAYREAVGEHMHRPESLEAFMQIASCYQRLKEPLEARATIARAKVVLQRVPPDASFNETTRYTRQEWAGVLDLLSNL